MILFIVGIILLLTALFIVARLYLSNEALIFLLSLVIVSYLGFTGISNNCFWDDEAQVAFFAKNFAGSGHMTGWDGRNLFTFRNGNLIDGNFRSINPPLDYFIAALSFKLFGNNTWSARYPFVIIGLITLVLFWVLLRQEFGSFCHARLYGAAAFGLSYSFLLNIRQCRYYSLCLLFSVLSYFLFVKCVRRGNVPHFIFLAVSLSLLFYSNYLLWACFSGALLVVFAAYHMRHAARPFFWKSCLTMVIAGALIVPYAIHFRIWLRPDMPGQTRWIEKAILLVWNFRELDGIGYLPVIVFLPLVFYLFRNRNNPAVPVSAGQWSVFIGAYVFLLALLSPQPAQWTGIHGGVADIRYLIVCLPFCAGIMGVFCAVVEKGIGRIAACLILCTVLCTNVLSLRLNDSRIRLLLPGYVREIHSNFVTPYTAAANYLTDNLKQDDTVVVLPEYAGQVMLYYLSDRVKIGGLLTDSTRLPKEKLALLKAPLFWNTYHPKWIISFGINPERLKWISRFSRDGYGYGCDYDSVKGAYTYVADAVLPYYWEDKTRPELPWHNFGPQDAFNPRSEAVYIFKRKNTGNETLLEDVSSRHGKAFY
jgi:hypothetical protein